MHTLSPCALFKFGNLAAVRCLPQAFFPIARMALLSRGVMPSRLFFLQVSSTQLYGLVRRRRDPHRNDLRAPHDGNILSIGHLLLDVVLSRGLLFLNSSNILDHPTIYRLTPLPALCSCLQSPGLDSSYMLTSTPNLIHMAAVVHMTKTLAPSYYPRHSPSGGILHSFSTWYLGR